MANGRGRLPRVEMDQGIGLEGRGAFATALATCMVAHLAVGSGGVGESGSLDVETQTRHSR